MARADSARFVPFRMTSKILLATLALTQTFALGCAAKEEELGVDVFSVDTLPAKIYMNLTGTLQMGLRADQYYTKPDKSLILGTPTSLIIQNGAGTATIISLDTTQRIAVQPLGISPDSAEKVAVVGTVVKLTRVGEEKRLKLEVERP